MNKRGFVVAVLGAESTGKTTLCNELGTLLTDEGREVVGDQGRIVSLDHYGASADYQRIYTEFGITAEAVAAAAHDSLRRD